MLLSDLLASAGVTAPGRAPHEYARTVTALTEDSRRVAPGAVFAAFPGSRIDGRVFMADAARAGAVAILVPRGTDVPADVTCPVIACDAPRSAFARMAATLAGPQPRHIVGVTGTNGKTSTVDFLRQIWAHAGRPAASLGTLGAIAPVALDHTPPALTTPDAGALAQVLAELARKGVQDVAMEASSHGLEQARLDGVAFSAAGFTNLTRDHLDYHGTIGEYRAAKLRLFTDLLPPGSVAAALADMDADTLSALRRISAPRQLDLRLVGPGGDAIELVAARPSPEGQVLQLRCLGRTHDLVLPLVGRFQVDNALLAAALAGPDEAALNAALAALPALRGVRGRMERAVLLPSGAAAYVDYAHTPDALQRLLEAVRPHATGRVICVFGAGGDRDRGKRPLMGAIAARLADVAIVTDDNPRSEKPEDIRREILAAAPGAIEIGDRARAIAEGLSMLHAGDLLVVAGKGHEQGQIIAGVVHPFDDCATLRTLAGQAPTVTA